MNDSTGIEKVSSNGIASFTEGNMQYAQKLIDSKLLPEAIKTPEQALIIIQKGRELGLGPIESFDSIDVIMGKPALKPKSKLMLALGSGVIWTKTIKDWEDVVNEEGKVVDKVTTIRFFRKVTDSIINEEDVSFKYSEAAQMGYLSKSNWKSQPGVMAFWRVMSRGLDRVCPDLTRGMYMSDEVADFMKVDYTMTEDGQFKLVE
jgi:hypothetical protein